MDMPVITAWQTHIDDLRSYLRDTAALNTLDSVQENTDLQLQEALLDSLQIINIEILPATAWTIDDVSTSGKSYLSARTVRAGAVLEILISNGILSARNTLTFNDSGGVTVQDLDKYGRYMAFYNMLYTKFFRSAQAAKKAWNVDQCYDGISSEWGYLGGGGRISNF